LGSFGEEYGATGLEGVQATPPATEDLSTTTTAQSGSTGNTPLKSTALQAGVAVGGFLLLCLAAVYVYVTFYRNRGATSSGALTVAVNSTSQKEAAVDEGIELGQAGTGGGEFTSNPVAATVVESVEPPMTVKSLSAHAEEEEEVQVNVMHEK
jgi:hypothetical protein